MNFFKPKSEGMMRLTASHYVRPDLVRAASALPADRYSPHAQVILHLKDGDRTWTTQVPTSDFDEAQAICARIVDVQNYGKLR